MLLQFEAHYRLFQFACHLNFLRVNCLKIKTLLHNYIGMQEFGEYIVEIPQGTVADEKLDKIADLLLLGMGTSKTNAWAGPEHWKYQKVKGTL